jgi:hypothetical protein
MNALLHASTMKPSLTNVNKRLFDASNAQDLQTYKKFLAQRTWGSNTCPFFLEWPWISIPDMINYKIAQRVTQQLNT